MEREWWLMEMEKWDRKCKEMTTELKKTKDLVERLREGHRRLSRARSLVESVVSRGRSRGNGERQEGVEQEEKMHTWHGKGGLRPRDLERGEIAVDTNFGMQTTGPTMVGREGQPPSEPNIIKPEKSSEDQAIKISVAKVTLTPKDRTIVIPEEGRPMGSSWQALKESQKASISAPSLEQAANPAVSELEGDRPDPGIIRDFEIKSLDHYAEAEMRKQHLYNQSRNRTHSSDLGLINSIRRQRRPPKGMETSSKRRRYQTGSNVNDSANGQVNPSQNTEGTKAHIVREGHGGMGSLQSDDNLIAAQELEESAVSFDSAEFELRRAHSQSRVGPWLEKHVERQPNERNGLDAPREEGGQIKRSKRSIRDALHAIRDRREKRAVEKRKQLVDMDKELPLLPDQQSKGKGE